MPHFGTKSKQALDTLEEELQDVLNEAIKHVDFSVVWGYRDMEAQNRAFQEGRSRNRWPTSKHNAHPSLAFDIVPYPAGYEASYERFYELASYVLAAATEYGVPLEWGGHWKNYTGRGENDRDWAHYELMI